MPPHAYPPEVIAAAERAKVYGESSIGDFFTNGNVDAWIVATSHRLGFEAGTPASRFKAIVREALRADGVG